MSEQKPAKKKSKKEMTAREQYNAVADTVTGANVRLFDNLLQAGAALVGLVVGVGSGALVAMFLEASLLVGCLIGALAGLIVGVGASGLFMMIYRMIKHSKGEHD